MNFWQNDTLLIMKCNHIEFLNSSIRRLQPCNTSLFHKTNNSNFFQPKLIHYFASIQKQFDVIFHRQGFENYLRHWADRTSFDNILADIYDRQVWKTFKENDSETSLKIFRPDVADSHLGLMLNLDWFQPFDRIIYSTGVLYATICNLPRDIQFKRENLIILGIMPGLNE